MGNPDSRPFPKWRPFRIWYIPAFGLPARSVRTATTAASTHQATLRAQVKHDHKRWHHHLSPPLNEGFRRPVITHHSSGMGSPRHHTSSSSKQGREPPTSGNGVQFTRQGVPHTCRLVHSAILAGASLGSGFTTTRRPLLIPFCDFPLISMDFLDRYFMVYSTLNFTF
jgi:hypothetical protein